MGYVELVLKRDGRFERLYARKRLHPHHRREPDLRGMFVDEARLAGLVRHPHVVSVLDIGEDGDGPFLIMDYVEGLPVARILDDAIETGRRLPVQVALRICAEAALGLHAAHEATSPEGAPLRLVHRDISPHNILVGFDGKTRVTDFGVAKAFGNTSRTTTGVLKGNTGYLSPEQLRFEEPDRRSDLFSLGVVLYELLSGERLYPSRDGLDALRRILHEPPPDIGDVRDDLPPELIELLFELLAKDPALRPATAQAVAARLEAIVAAMIEVEGIVGISDLMMDRFGGARADRKRELAAHLERLATEEPAAAATTRWRAWIGGRRRWVALAVVAVVGGAALLLPLSSRTPTARPGERRDLWAGGWHTCALEDDNLFCWGKGADGQLGDGLLGDRSGRVLVPEVRQVGAAALGMFHTCVCDRSGGVFCWGRNQMGELGASEIEAANRPMRVNGISDCVAIAAGSSRESPHTCAATSSGTVACWGSNLFGQLGRPADSDAVAAPSTVRGLSGVVEVGAGEAFTCARRSAGDVLCWGRNDVGQLGIRHGPGHAPAPVEGVADAAEIAVGRQFACARRRSGRVVCWGQMGDVAAAEVDGVANVVQVAAGHRHACGLLASGRLVCWGANEVGQLGDGKMQDSSRPVSVAEIPRFLSIAAGGLHSCGRHAGGISCWGQNSAGQLGDVTKQNRRTPVSVTGFR
jgi:eukaryotic-like serine/threonine-protein kinase